MYIQYKRVYVILLIVVLCFPAPLKSHKNYTKRRKLELREDVRRMFQHAYEGYLRYASNYDELRPLTCDGHDTWGSYSLTMIDALDTLATMGNFTEFRRVVNLLQKNMNFDKDINVSVFETNIRIVGGLLSAHLISKRAQLPLEPGWPCQGPLLRMAEDVVQRLLPAFDTNTGMPYGTVNLRYGVPTGETPITCTAGVGTFLVEFGTLSRLTGNPIYENVALNAVYALWSRRSAIGLFGNHIDVQTGRWTALDSGIGAGVDSFFEYLVKGSILLNRPELMKLFHDARESIDKYLRKDDWYIWAGMNKGHVTLPVFQSLESFWPGILSIIGDHGPAIRTITKYISVWNKYGFLPEFYNIPAGEVALNREVYPLRPEMVESAMYIYRATKNQLMLELGESFLNNIEFSAKTKCGYATIRNVVTHEKENRMESFFLAETTKYLYLLFDEDNFLHNSGDYGDAVETSHGKCSIHVGSYIFNTEAHPIDMSALYCCHDINVDIYSSLDLKYPYDNDMMRNYRDSKQNSRSVTEIQHVKSKENLKEKKSNIKETSLIINMHYFDKYDQLATDDILKKFARLNKETTFNMSSNTGRIVRNQLTINDLEEFFSYSAVHFKKPEEALNFVVNFMRNFTLDVAFIRDLQIMDENITNVLGAAAQTEFESEMRTLWDLYELQQRYLMNVQLIRSLGLLNFTNSHGLNMTHLLSMLDNTYRNTSADNTNSTYITNTINEVKRVYGISLVNTTAMQQFLHRIYVAGTNEEKPKYYPLLTDAQLKVLTSISIKPHEERELFTYARRFVDVLKHMVDTIERLQTLVHSKQVQTDQPSPTDGVNGQKEKVVLERKFNDNTPQEIPQYTINLNKDSHDDSISLWSQLLRKFLRTTIVKSDKFDERVLLEKTRKSLQKYLLQTVPSYELFTCERPKFIEIFAYRKHYPQTYS